MAGSSTGFNPAQHVERLEAILQTGYVPLVCDTNVYLDAREAIGVEDNGHLRVVHQPAAVSPAVTVLRAPSVAGIPTRFILAVTVQSELYHLIRGGYEQRPVGLQDSHRTADAIRNLMRLHPLGQVERGGATYEASLPDPPLSAAERNDRHIWCQAQITGAFLITCDRRLLEAVRMATGNPVAAMTPLELIDLAAAFLESHS